MTTAGMGNASLKMQIGIDVMKKAMDTEARQILSMLQSAGTGTRLASPDRAAGTPPAADPSALTGLGRNIDLKA